MADHSMKNKVKVPIGRYQKYRMFVPLSDNEIQKYRAWAEKKNGLDKDYRKILFGEEDEKNWQEKITWIIVSDTIPADINIRSSNTNICSDISEGKDGSVIGWLEKSEAAGNTGADSSADYILHIDGDGKIYAPTNCSDLFSQFPQVKKIEFGDAFDTSQTTDMSTMFFKCPDLQELDVSRFDTQRVTDMYCMFGCCSGLERLNVSGFDTRSVTNMNSMFWQCRKLETLDVSGFDTRNVASMSNMFAFCSSLQELNVSGFDTWNVTDMNSMFAFCSGLQKLDVSRFDTQNAMNMGYMFFNCFSLRELDVSRFDTQNVTDMRSMFRNCRSLTGLDTSRFNMEKVTCTTDMFSGCPDALSKNAAGKGQVERGQAEKGQVERGQAEKGQVEREQAEKGQVEKGQAEKRQAKKEQAKKGQAKKGQAEKEQAEKKESRKESDIKEEKKSNMSGKSGKDGKITYIGISLQSDKGVAAVCGAEKTIIIAEIPCSEPEFLKKIDRGINPAAEMTIMFHRIRMKAEEYLNRPVNGAVIAIPVVFDLVQRQWIKNAARAAGWQQIRFLENVTAAGLYCEKNHLKGAAERRNVLICSYEDGFINASALEIDSGLVEVLAAEGSRHLDKRISEEKILENILEVMKQTLHAAGSDWPDVDKVIFVGNFSCMSALVYQMEAIRAGLKFNYTQSKSIAMGVAMQAGKLNGNPSMKDILLLDILTQSLSISTPEGMNLVIDKDTTIPTKHTIVVTTTMDYQTEADIGIFQGQKGDIGNQQKLGIFRLERITPAPCGKCRIEVTVDCDYNGKIGLRVQEKGTNARLEIADIMEPHNSCVDGIRMPVKVIDDESREK